MVREVAAQRTAADREDHVVERRAAHQRADLLALADLEAARVEHAVRRDLGIEARARVVVGMAERVADQPDHLWRELREGPGDRP
ncbi:MAG: hypothetical protein U1F11_04270 [Steroidobacteraceae bacterium]